MNAVTPEMGALLTNREKWLPEDLSTKIKAGLEPLSGLRGFACEQWRNVWLKASSKLVHDPRAWGASIRDW